MKTLHELAVKLQEHIIRQQQDAHNQTNMNVTKYNNLKLKIETKLHYPHVIVCIGISEAIFNIREGTKTDGSLGPDEKYVRKWLHNSSVISDLKEIYIAMTDLVAAEEEDKMLSMVGEADEAKKDTPRKKQKFRNLLDNAMPLESSMAEVDEPGEEMISIDEESRRHNSPSPVQEESPDGSETVEQAKKGLADMIKSMFRKK